MVTCELEMLFTTQNTNIRINLPLINMGIKAAQTTAGMCTFKITQNKTIKT